MTLPGKARAFKLLTVLLIAGSSQSLIAAPQILRGPYLQLPSETSILVAWSTDVPVASSVEFSTELSKPRRVFEPELVTQHALKLEDLQPSTAYKYRIMDGENALSTELELRTAPTPDSMEPFKLVAFGDSGGGTQAQEDVARNISAARPELCIHVGDLAYPGGIAEDLDRLYFDVYRDTISRTALFPALGNKDVESDDGEAILEAFYLPAESPSPERYYSFIYGSAYFVALDTNQSLEASSAQHDWLLKALADATRSWKIVYFHHPIYGSGGGNEGLRQSLEPLFDAYRVDLVFQGHTHFYERSLPMRNGSPADSSPGPEYRNPEGTIYFVTGGGGGTLAKANPKSFSAHYESSYHHVEITITGSRLLTLRAVNREGDSIDSISILKEEVREDCCNLKDDDGDGKIDFSDEDCVARPECSPIPFHRGDADGNGVIQITDAVAVLGFLFLGSPAPFCLEAADADDTGTIQITDAVQILAYAFLGGDPFPAPGPPGAGTCGTDPPGSPKLSCVSYVSCL